MDKELATVRTDISKYVLFQILKGLMSNIMFRAKA